MLNFAQTCWFLSGPTAAGKSAVAIELAKEIDAEIISMDSMAIFEGMDIGTAKPDSLQRKAVPHHLIDVVPPDQDYSVAQFLANSERSAQQILAAGRQVLFVGGTPLYLKALLRGLFEGPPADWGLRTRLEEQANLQGSEVLHRRLSQIDPQAAVRLHPRDTRRLIRAIEVFEATGQPISELQREFENAHSAEKCKVFVLDWPRDRLNARINERVDRMFADGLVNEVQRLLEQYSLLSRTAAQAVGYREVIEHLQGERDLPQTIELVKLRTRQFAKRQLTWFRSLSECRMVAVDDFSSTETLANQITRLGRSCV